MDSGAQGAKVTQKTSLMTVTASLADIASNLESSAGRYEAFLMNTFGENSEPQSDNPDCDESVLAVLDNIANRIVNAASRFERVLNSLDQQVS